MDNYIIFKGIDSRNIQGVIICTLPPITTPGKRYSSIAIDGRDGDIVVEEGYQAYDKVIEIGLARNYDLDQIMSWLNGKGQLIMSNEPGKYYEAEILVQIDYEKLLRFKKAIVKFHVQPYKYYYDEHDDEATTSPVVVYNKGMIKSKPTITLEGSGSVVVALNGTTAFTYTFPSGETKVVIDCKEEDAYLDGVLKNRNMNGGFIELLPGRNTISWTGTLTKITISPNSKWL